MAAGKSFRVNVKLLVLCLVMLLVGAGVTALAQAPAPPIYTGCLKSTGTIVKVKRGPSPLSACAVGDTVIKLSSGDISEIATAAGSGLTGGVTAGAANLAVNFTMLDARYTPNSPATRACFDVIADEEADVSYCNMQGKDWTGATLLGADLRFADFTGARLGGAVLSNANATRAVLRFADLRNAFMPNADLTRANLYGALMEGANITGVTWQNTICPDGTSSNANGNTCDGHLNPKTP